MIRHTRAAAVAAVLALGVLAACGGEGAPTGAAPAGSAPGGLTPSGVAPGGEGPGAGIGCAAPGPSARPKGAHRVVADGRTVTGIAPGLGLPPGVRIADAADSGNAATVTVSAPEPQRVLEHYRGQGPECGYRIVNDEGSVLYLTGHGWGVQVVAQGSETTIAFRAAPKEPKG
jgi:hypothetical protein